jgi:methionine-rich copper-binding protein CopC
MTSFQTSRDSCGLAERAQDGLVATRSVVEAVLVLVLLSRWQTRASGHAFLERAEPGVGAVLTAVPEKIVLQFDSELELPFSGFRIETAC